jgi:hypothetical protein
MLRMADRVAGQWPKVLEKAVGTMGEFKPVWLT